MSETRRVIIKSGAGWTDAGVDLLDVPRSMDLEKENDLYREWLTKEYNTGQGGSYKTFAGWLLEKGANNNEDIEEFWEN